MKKILFAIIALTVVVSMVFAAATGTIYNTDVDYREGPKGTDLVVYENGTATLTTATDSIGITYTQAMYIAPFASSTDYALIYMDLYDATATEDANISIEYSNDLTTWIAGAGVIKDQLTTTAVVDTVNYVTGTEDLLFKTFDYMRIKADWQAGNSIGTYLIFNLRLQKPTGVGFPLRQGHVADKK